MNTHLQPSDIIRRAHAVGNYYGFVSLAAAAAAKKNSNRAPYPESINLEALDPAAREVVGLLKHVRDAGLAPTTLQPLFVWHTNAAPGRPAPKTIIIQFHALGAEHSIADAVLVRAVRAFVSELTKTEAVVRLNSMGDKETRSRFARELTQYFRKQGALLPADCIACAKQDVLKAAELLAGGNESEGMPSPTDHLSESSRKHFESVLEYLEATDTPYELTPDLLSRGPSWTDTCFEITTDDARIRAWGSRYTELAKPFFKNPLPSIGAVIRITVDDRSEIPSVKERTNPRFFFVHIGEEAKRESMKMADTLRHARIPLAQAIGIQSLTEQMRFADIAKSPYLLIMGRKEALERSVILRERSTHTETFIPLDHLVDQLKLVA